MKFNGILLKYLLKWQFLLICFGKILRSVVCSWPVAMETRILTEQITLNLDFTIILPIKRIKNAVKNVDRIFLKMADQLYLDKIVLIMLNECSKANITHNSVNHSNNEQHTQTNHRTQTNRLLTPKHHIAILKGTSVYSHWCKII